MPDPTTALSIVSIALIGLFLVQEYRHGKERKDLYSRIMARDLTDYKVAERPAKKEGRVRNFVFSGIKRNKELIESYEAKEGE